MDKKKGRNHTSLEQIKPDVGMYAVKIEPIQILPEYKTEQAQRPKNFRTVILFKKKEEKKTSEA